MFKNVASQKIALFAFDTTTGAAKTGDAANITPYVSIDYGSVTALTDTSAAEMDSTNAKGWYVFDVTQAESNGDALLFTAKSSTANISVVGHLIYTLPASFTSFVTPPTAAVIADAVWDEDATGHQTGGTFGQAIGDPGADTTTIYAATVTGAAGTHIAADIIAIKTETASILSDTNAILVDTAEIGAAGAGLTAINLPNQTMDIVGNITGNLSGSVGSVTGAVGSVTGAVGSVTGNVGGNVTGTIGGLTAAALKDFFDTDSTTTYASAVAGSVVKEIADNAGGASLTVQDIVDGVWDEDATGHQTQGTFGQAIGDPAADANTIYGAVVTGAAGATVAADIIAIKAETAAIVADTGTDGVVVASIAANAITASALAADAGAEIADAVLNRDMSTGTDSGSTTVRTPRQALRFLRNKWSISGTTLTVTKEDDSTASWTSEVTATNGADPITANDPAGP